MATTMEALRALLDLEPLEVNLFRGQSEDIGSPAVFGGQVLGQALVAAQRTVPADRLCHSLHAYFILPGDKTRPIVYDVERIRDGGSFTTRRIVAVQHGRRIFNMSASFQLDEDGPDHQRDAPDVPGPDGLRTDQEIRAELYAKLPPERRPRLTRGQAFDLRPVEVLNPLEPVKTPAQRHLWLRAAVDLPDDPTLHRALLAYVSDFGLLPTALLPHGISYFTKGVRLASLDHALWFHRPFRMDDWLLYGTESPSASGARGFTRGHFFDRDGRLVASVCQEGLTRARPPKRPGEGTPAGPPPTSGST